MTLNDLRKDLKEKKIIFGANTTLKKLRAGKLKRIYLASNCRKDIAEDIVKYGKINDVEVVKLKKTNEELGTLCKKPFSISVLSY
jgi:large subunit ribosomal protein L30e